MIRVLIADDHPAIRAGLVGELAGDPDIEVVGQAADGEETLRLAEALEPDVVLLDIVMPGLRAPEVVRRLLVAQPELRVLVLTAYGEEGLVLGLLRAGARGYLLKDEELGTVVKAVQGVMRGETWLSPKVAGTVVARAVAAANSTDEGDGPAEMGLTERQMEVLRLLARGKSNVEIGRELGISERGVRYHLSNIYSKLGVSSRAGAMSWAARKRVN